MPRIAIVCALVVLALSCLTQALLANPKNAKRLNHEGRVLPEMPAIKQPALFNTPAADAILASLQVFPKDNPWNEDISKRPVLKNSAAMIARIGADAKLHGCDDMCFVLVPPDQKRIDVKLAHRGESDKGPYPIPENAPIEGWPKTPRGKPIDFVQRNGDGDRHLLVIDPTAMLSYEFYNALKTDADWTADNVAIFDLQTNKLRPKGWTSADAAGLPIFPAVIRYDECERGMVEHAIRFSVPQTRMGFIHPARHQASKLNDADLPAMGQRFRLKASFDVNAYPKHAKAVLLAMKKYGMIVADHGSAWHFSVAPDERFRGLNALHKLKGSDFEVIESAPEGIN
jgi:hypothetical protein